MEALTTIADCDVTTYLLVLSFVLNVELARLVLWAALLVDLGFAATLAEDDVAIVAMRTIRACPAERVVAIRRRPRHLAPAQGPTLRFAAGDAARWAVRESAAVREVSPEHRVIWWIRAVRYAERLILLEHLTTLA